MKTRFSSLVGIKQNEVDKKEQELQQALINVKNAQEAYELSVAELQKIAPPSSGTMQELLQNRELLTAQRALIEHNKKWLEFAQNALAEAQQALKMAMMELEKFRYLELEEIEKILKEQKYAEAKLLDEVALMTFNRQTSKRSHA